MKSNRTIFALFVQRTTMMKVMYWTKGENVVVTGEHIGAVLVVCMRSLIM